MDARRGLLLTLFALLLPAAAQGVRRCELTDTLESCWERYLPSDPATAAVEGAADRTAAELRRQNTGVDTGGTSLGSTTKNLLPLLAISGLLGDVERGDTAGTLVVDLNPVLGQLTGGRKLIQLQGVIHTDPEVSSALEMALPEEQRDEVVEQLQRGLGDLDDVTLRATFNWNGRRHGRSFGLHRERFAALAKLATTRVADDLATDRELALARLLRDFPDLADKRFEEISQDVAQQRQARDTVEEAAAATADLQLATGRALANEGLDRFAQLVNNQPQLHLQISQRLRRPAIGGDETTVRLSYELGGANLNRALASPSCRELQTREATGCLASYARYVRAYQQAVDNGSRLVFSAEYVDVEEDSVDLPEVGRLQLPGTTKLIASLGFSRYLRVGGEEDPVRLDLMAGYEDVSDDPMRRDRLVAQLTLTKKIRGVTIPFGLVYANHGEFLPDVDEELNAHLGLRFELGGGTP